MANGDWIIGVDASTTACKVVVWDCQGKPINSGRAALSVAMPRVGWHEQESESWWRALVGATRRALKGLDTSRLAGLAIAHQRETFVPLDGQGKALRPGIVWMDERTAEMMAELERLWNPVEFHRQTGKPLSGNLTIAKMAWLKEHEPDVFQKTGRYLDVHAFLVHRLTGLYRTGWGCADPTGLFDMNRQDWAVTLLDKIGVKREQLPEALPPGVLLGYVTRSAAAATGLPEGLPVFAGLGDGQAGGVGANICQPGTAYLTLGTSVISGSYSGEYVTDRSFRTMYGGVPGSYLLETVLLGGAYTISWLLNTFLGKRGAAAARERDRLEAALDAIPAGSEGLVLVPYWNTVMNPYWDAAASGITLGWRGIHRPEHLYRAILEGIAMEVRLEFEGVENALHAPIQRVVAMGGGAHSQRWCQIMADITGKPVQRTAVDEAAALGAGILAASGAGLYTSVSEAAQKMAAWQPEVFEPDPSRNAFYSDLYTSVYKPLYPALRSPMQRLSTVHHVERAK
jgi:sugar (pentulose or hexulose) kinase